MHVTSSLTQLFLPSRYRIPFRILPESNAGASKLIHFGGNTDRKRTVHCSWCIFRWRGTSQVFSIEFEGG
jgi:hypothetical protein